MRVIQGSGIKFLDEEVEAAAFRILIGVYAYLVHIENYDNLDEVLFVFKKYIYSEYERLYSFIKKLDNVKDYDACNYIEVRLKYIKNSIEDGVLITPSEILSELDTIKRFKKLIHVQEVSVSCCIKLK